MFSFFKKKPDPKPTIDLGFSKSQIASIVCALSVIAKCDNNVAMKELMYISDMCDALGISQSDSMVTAAIKGGKGPMLATLNTLTRSQKEWLIIAIHGLIHADGKVVQIELDYAQALFEQIGVSAQEYIYNVQKAQAIAQQLGR
jgi:uncharacterized tellurite resistance protein B-like protein